MPAQLVSGSNGLLRECYTPAEKIQQKIEVLQIATDESTLFYARQGDMACENRRRSNQ